MKLTARVNPRNGSEIWLTFDKRKPTAQDHDWKLSANHRDGSNSGKVKAAIQTLVGWINSCSEELTLTAQCIGCKAKRDIDEAEAERHSNELTLPLCEKCHRPMIIVRAAP